MILRRILSSIVSLIPDKLAAILSEELTQKAVRYQKTTVNHGSNFYLAANTVILSPDCVSFGNDCAVNEFVHILGNGGVTIGSGVWIANHVSLVSVTHPSDVEFIGDHPHITASIEIEDHVWVGSHVTIMPGIRLGRSCIVGAGSVVTKDVPPYAIVAGVPAKILRYKSIAPSIITAHE